MSDAFNVRASSWGGLFDCAYKWEYVHLLGNRTVAGVRALLGSAIHASTAAFDAAIMEGGQITPDDAAEVFVDTLRHPDWDVNYAQDDLSVDKAEPIGLILHTKYCLEVSPRYNFVAVERETKPLEVDCGGGVIIRLTGTLDRSRSVKTVDGKPKICDLKSGGQAVQNGVAKTKGHKAQIGTYQLLEEHTTGKEVDDEAEIIGLKTSGKAEIATGTIHGGKQLMVGTDEAPGLIEIAANMFRSGLFPPNPSSFLCSDKYCPRWDSCPYKNP